MQTFFFIAFPYIALILAIGVGLYRYFSHRFTYSSLSSQLLENLKRFLSAAGIEIAAVEGLGGEFGSHEKHQIIPSDLQRRVLSVARQHRDFDAIFVQSGTLATMGILDALEQAIGTPVVSSNCANTWAFFKPLGIKANPGHGKLLSSL